MEDKTEAVAPEVNRLYWQTADSVADISNRLGVSRRALYELVQPFPAGVECLSCGAEMHFANRSAKTANIARCLVCGSEREIESAVSSEDVGTVPPYSAGWPSAKKPASNGVRERAVMVAGFALAGVVVGAVATVLIRRMR